MSKAHDNILVHMRLPSSLRSASTKKGGKKKQGISGKIQSNSITPLPAEDGFYAEADEGVCSDIEQAKKLKAGKTKNDKRPSYKANPLLIGVWDLGAWLGQLPGLLEKMNRVQSRYRFTAIQATVPLGIIRVREGVVEWAEHCMGRKLKEHELQVMKENTVSNDFFELAETVRKDLNIDYLVGVTPGMVAGADDEGIYWNHFCTCNRRLILASTYDLRNYAKISKHPFELFLAGIIIAQLLVAQFIKRGLGFHYEDRGCLFDYNEDRVSIMDKIRDLHIEPDCLEKIAPGFRNTAKMFVQFLQNYK